MFKIFNSLSPVRIKYASNTAWLLLEKGFRILDAFFVGIWLARYLGPEDYGILSFAESFVYLFASLAALGLDQIVVRELVKNKYSQGVILGTTLGLRILGFILMFLILLGTLHLLKVEKVAYQMVLVISLSIAFQSFKGIDFYFQSKVASKYTVYSSLIGVVFLSLAKVYLILSNAPLLDFAYVIATEWLIIALGYLYFYRYRKENTGAWKFSLTVGKYLFSKSWILILGSVAAALYMKIDQVMIKELLGNQAVGIYSVAVKLTSIWIFVTVAITQSVFPYLVKLHQQDTSLYEKRLQQLYDGLVKIAVIVAICFSLFSDFLTETLFGEAYSGSSIILSFYIWSIIFVFLSNASWSFYLNKGLERISSIRLVIGAIINIILNVLFIRTYGLIGATYATLISYAISSFFINLFFKKTQQNFYFQTRAFINIFNLTTWIKPI